jgi:hypothetical protein
VGNFWIFFISQCKFKFFSKFWGNFLPIKKNRKKEGKEDHAYEFKREKYYIIYNTSASNNSFCVYLVHFFVNCLAISLD